jgi:hypothetical protein
MVFAKDKTSFISNPFRAGSATSATTAKQVITIHLRLFSIFSMKLISVLYFQFF